MLLLIITLMILTCMIIYFVIKAIFAMLRLFIAPVGTAFKGIVPRKAGEKKSFGDTDYAEIGELIRGASEDFISKNASVLRITEFLAIDEFRVDTVGNPVYVQKDEDVKLLKNNGCSSFKTYYKIYIDGKLYVKRKDGERLILECSDIPYFFDKKREDAMVCFNQSMIPIEKLQEFAPITEEELHKIEESKNILKPDEETKKALIKQYKLEIDNAWKENRKKLITYNVCKAFLGPPIIFSIVMMIGFVSELKLKLAIVFACSAFLYSFIIIKVKTSLEPKKVGEIEKTAKKNGINAIDTTPPGLRDEKFFIYILAIIGVLWFIVMNS